MILTGLLVGAALGFVLQRGRFCVTGAYRDLWTTRSTRWFTAFLVVVAVQSVGLFTLDSLGVIELESKQLPWIATIVGAFIFGLGIILAAGCATGTYYRAGEGLVGSWFALVFYALSAAMMKYGALSDLNTAARDRTTGLTTIHETLHVSPWVLVVIFSAGVALLVRHHLAKPKVARATLPARRTGLAHVLLEKNWHPFATGAVIGLIGVAAWPLSAATGRNDGLGVTTPSANLVKFLTTGDPAALDWGVMLVVGILLGSYVAAKASGEFRVRVPDATVIVRSIVGGLAMGVGAALAGGCTVGNGMVKTAQFTWQGWIAVGFMILGAGLGARLFITGPARRAASQSSAPRTPAGV